jgi:hypothetical protein
MEICQIWSLRFVSSQCLFITCLQTVFHIVNIHTKFQMPGASSSLPLSKLLQFSNGKQLTFCAKKYPNHSWYFWRDSVSVSLRPYCWKIGSTVLECPPLAQCTLQVSCNHLKWFKNWNGALRIIWWSHKACQSTDVYSNSWTLPTVFVPLFVLDEMTCRPCKHISCVKCSLSDCDIESTWCLVTLSYSMLNNYISNRFCV